MNEKSRNQDVNLYLELSKLPVFTSLVPDHKQILVLAMLYQRECIAIKNNELIGSFVFSEEDIRSCLRQVQPPRQREQHEDYSQLIRELQVHFIWRNEETGLYMFKEYTRKFLRLLLNHLEQNIQPTYLKRIFANLMESLDRALNQHEDHPERFELWLDQDFEHSRIDISVQIEALYTQVDELVQTMREEIRSDADTLLETLEYVVQKLDTLSEYAQQMGDVGHDTVIVQQRLRTIQMSSQDNFMSRITHAMVFLDETRDKLAVIKQRIARIRPYIQRLFNVTQRKLDFKTGKFLEYLLKNSQIINQQLQFPSAIPDFPLFREQLRFTTSNKQDFLPQRPIMLEKSRVDKIIRTQQRKIYDNKQYRLEQIQKWIDTVDIKIETEGFIKFSPIFFQILEDNDDGTAIVLEVIQRILRYYTMYPLQYHVIMGHVIHYQQNYEYTLCEVIIHKQIITNS